MDVNEILALNSKAVLKRLTKSFGYPKKEISDLRRQPIGDRLHILSKYFEELRGINESDLHNEVSRGVES